MKVLVIYGGLSAEREVSLKSGENVINALRLAGHEIVEYDPADDPEARGLKQAASGCDVAFPILHGTGGEDGKIQSQLDEVGIHYVGSDTESSKNCFDKKVTLTTVGQAGVNVPATEVVNYEEFKQHTLITHPFVLKPVNDGSSVDTFLIRDLSDFNPAQFEDLFKKRKLMILEELIEGIEVTVPILDTQTLPVIEIIPPSGEEFDFINKYNGATQELCPPPDLTKEQQESVQAIALKIHILMHCRHLSRSDFILDKNGNFYFLEINTLPGMTEQSLYPGSAKVAGIGMSDLADRLVRMAAG